MYSSQALEVVGSKVAASADAKLKKVNNAIARTTYPLRVGCPYRASGCGLAAELGANLGGDSIGKGLNAFYFRPFHHHARQRLGAGKTYQDPARIAKGILGSSDFSGHAGQIFQALSLLDADIYQTLRIYLNLL